MNDFKNNNNDDIETVFFELISQGDPLNQLPDRLKSLRYPDKILTSLFRRDEQCLSLLMLAALHGHDQLVRLLLSSSSNVKRVVELNGSVLRLDGKLTRNATALWCACDRGNYTVARTLIELGRAQVEHGPKYPLLIDAIITGRLDTVQFLTENNFASLESPTKGNQDYKVNSLIMAIIHGQQTIVEYLLHVVHTDLNQSTPSTGNSPLSYAAIRGHLPIVRLLCSAGASTSSKNKSGHTPLILAAKYSHFDVLDYLFNPSDLRELELLACSLITPPNTLSVITRHQIEKLSKLLSKIFDLRSTRQLEKRVAEPVAAYNNQRECQTLEEFRSIQHDPERLYIETLLIRERLLLPCRDQALFKPLLVYGDRVIRRGEFPQALHLLRHTFFLYQTMNLDTGLHRFVWILCKMLKGNVPISGRQFDDIARLTFEPSQQKDKDDYLKNAVCLLAVAVKVLEQPQLTPEDQRLVHQWIFDLCRLQRRTSTGQTLLHLSVDVQTYFDINYRAGDIRPLLR